MTTKTFWISFTDPIAGRHLGCCVIEIDEVAAALEQPDLPPTAQPGAEWLAAAVRWAWLQGCNPGGQVAAYEIPLARLGEVAKAPRNRLMQAAELEARGLVSR